MTVSAHTQTNKTTPSIMVQTAGSPLARDPPQSESSADGPQDSGQQLEVLPLLDPVQVIARATPN